MAPDLVKIQRYFADDEVVFISLTPDNEATSTEFTHRYRIGWSTGWGANTLLQQYLGDRFPVLLVIGRDGRVVWNDSAARRYHRYEVMSQLFERIKKEI